MRLFYLPGACSLADHIVLRWAGVPHDVVRVSRESIRSELYLQLNPSGTVPFLQHGDFSLSENVAILGYIADHRPEAALLGNGSLQSRASVMRWLGYLNSDVHMAFRPILSPSKFIDDETHAETLRAQGRAEVRRHLQRLDEQLEGRAWLTGSRSVADPYLFVVLRWATRKDVVIDGYRNLVDFFQRMHADVDVAAAVAIEEGAPG